ncbi:HesB family protein [Moritella sp. PE36]|nr:HesB family protein [Moritella sp. PE36]
MELFTDVGATQANNNAVVEQAVTPVAVEANADDMVLPIHFSDAAAARVKELITEEENLALKLRVYVTGGGCSGFSYGFTFDEKINFGDTVIEKNGVTMVVDSMSLQYLVDGTVDYIDGLEGSRFLVNNPNATTTCGCGSSFSI